LWSLAVEEQFYLIWPLIMVVLLGRKGTRSVAGMSRWLFIAAVAIAVISASLYYPGVISDPESTPNAYWFIGDHPISKLDFAYIGTFSRMSGILLGAAFAMVWRPFAVIRGPLRTKGRVFDVAALLALLGLAWMCWNLYLVTPAGVADPRLFRGGLFGASCLTLVMLAAVSHSGARANGILGNPVLKWIGLRSYGLYLYHWPVYQAIRELAGNKLTVTEFIVAMAITVAITEVSYRFVETPIRTGSFRTTFRRARTSASAFPRRALLSVGALAVVMTVFAGAALATADLEQSEIADTFTANEDATVQLGAPDVASPAPEQLTPTVTSSPSTTVRDVRVPVSTVAPPTTTRPTTAPSTTVAPTTAPPTTVAPTTAPPTTAPPPPEATSLGIVNDMSTITPLVTPPQGKPPELRLIGFGDSVMLGSAEELSARGFVVDAVQSRQFSAALPEFQAIKDRGLFGSAVVVHLGTNGSFPQSSLDQMMAMLVDVPRVVFVTGKADRGWIAGNNEKLRALPMTYPNVTVLDWEVLGPQCQGDCFYDDNIHLNGAGQAYYTDLITRILGV
ncbi:acyltransferase family protein, partial [Ilumatobacter nonamiensis]|uniref:acyltransferase family protein n=1 Tax=Ilumatobacter nonamiensis TaxID=467093 RepID=UPI00058DA5D9